MNGAERFLQEFAGWHVNEWSPPAGSQIDEAARVAVAAVALGATSVAFRFNGIRLVVESGDTAEGITSEYYAARGEKP